MSASEWLPRYGIFPSLPIKNRAKAITAQGYLPRRDGEWRKAEDADSLFWGTLNSLGEYLRSSVEKLHGRTRVLRDLAVGRLLKVELTLAFRSRIMRSFIFEQSCYPKSMKRPSRRGKSREMCDKNKV